MDHVVGLSVTSAAVRRVLVEGASGEGATIDHGTVDLATIRTLVGADERAQLVRAVLGPEALAAPADVRCVGVTWSPPVAAEACMLMEALTACDIAGVVAVSETEATEALGTGIAYLAGHDEAAVCVVEPDSAVIASIRPDSVFLHRLERTTDRGGDAVGLSDDVMATVGEGGLKPEAIFAIGSAEDLDAVVSSLQRAASCPVVSAAEADLALARGAALASARSVFGLDAWMSGPAAAESPQARSRFSPATSRVGAIAAVLAAAVVTFVASVSAAIGLHTTPRPLAATLDQRPAVDLPRGAEPLIPEQPVAEPLEQPRDQSGPTAPAPEAVLVTARTIAVQAPPPAELPPVPADVPPAPFPADAPPAVPVYAPPVSPGYVQPLPPQVRLRDQILERIPIINRFNDPQSEYPAPVQAPPAPPA